jgi:hypothetical protein
MIKAPFPTNGELPISKEREHRGNEASSLEVTEAERTSLHEEPQQASPKRNNGRISKKRLIAAGLVGGVLLSGEKIKKLISERQNWPRHILNDDGYFRESCMERLQ